jgi:hypothetical protein
VSPLIRSLAAVLFGVGLFAILDQVLETVLVRAAADAQIANLETYFAIRNEPQQLGAKVVYNILAALLGGFMTARIAGREELQHAIVAALVVTAQLAWAFTMSDFAGFTPVWTRAALLLVVGPSMVAGGWVRARAVQLRSDDVGGGPGASGQPRRPGSVDPAG